MAERFRLRSVGLGGPENSEIRRGWLLSHTTTTFKLKIERFKIDLIEEGRSHSAGILSNYHPKTLLLTLLNFLYRLNSSLIQTRDQRSNVRIRAKLPLRRILRTN